MKSYFYHDGQDQKGPYSIDELKDKAVKLDTLVWCEGMTEWLKASEVAELSELFKNLPPPINSLKVSGLSPGESRSGNVKQTSSKSGSSAGLLKRLAVLLIIVLGVYAAILFSQSQSNSNGKVGESYQEKIMTVAEIEQANPSEFLHASGSYRQTFFGDAMKIEGVIANNATVAKYKDIVVEVVFYTETDTELERRQYVVYEKLLANSTKNFNLKVERPKACKKIGLNAIDGVIY